MEIRKPIGVSDAKMMIYDQVSLECRILIGNQTMLRVHVPKSEMFFFRNWSILHHILAIKSIITSTNCVVEGCRVDLYRRKDGVFFSAPLVGWTKASLQSSGHPVSSEATTFLEINLVKMDTNLENSEKVECFPIWTIYLQPFPSLGISKHIQRDASHSDPVVILSM